MLRRQRRYENRPEATLIHVEAPQGSFSFFLRDVNRNTPIYIPNYKVTVLPAGDGRCYAEVEREILSRKSRTKIERIETEPEVSFETAAARARRSNVPIWLGMGRDIRMFEISEELPDGTLEDKLIRPIFSSSPSYCRKRPLRRSTTGTRWDAAWESWITSPGIWMRAYFPFTTPNSRTTMSVTTAYRSCRSKSRS